jgi:hypothetical protein
VVPASEKNSVAWASDTMDSDMLGRAKGSFTCVYLPNRFFDREDDFPMGALEKERAQAQTLIHEISHVQSRTTDEDVDGDDAVGRVKCLKLLRDDRVKARSNADSLACFARDLDLFAHLGPKVLAQLK